MDEIIALIKQSDEYKDYMIKQKELEKEKDFLEYYQEIMQEYSYQKEYADYIDISDIKEKVKSCKKEMAQNEIIVAYYQSYYQLNDLLEEVTRIIFKDLIDTSLLQPYFQ